MTKEEYLKTVVVDGKKIEVGMDDYGQCYFYEWEEDGEIKSESCGTYNFDYMSQIMYHFCDEYRNLVKKYYYGGGLDKAESAKLKEYEEYISKENSHGPRN